VSKSCFQEAQVLLSQLQFGLFRDNEQFLRQFSHACVYASLAFSIRNGSCALSPSNIAAANSVRQSRGSLITHLLYGAESHGSSVFPRRFERMQGIQRVLKGFLFFEGAVSVKDFSSARHHCFFSLRN
jgi:hypothetical protein